MTYGELLRSNHAVPDAKNLLFGLKNWSLTDFIVHENETVNAAFSALYEAGLQRLRNHEPVQYVLGEAWFYGRKFKVSPAVLIPRLDTEILIRTVLADELPDCCALLDLCTGSGCIGLTLKAERPDFEVTCSDISDDALAAARDNSENMGIPVRFLKSDLFHDITCCYDAIVSNPPYIRDAEIESLDPEVRDFEPRLALSGHEDGLFFYEKIAREAAKHLSTDGRIYLEIGCDEADDVAALLENEGFFGIEVVKDLAGLPRVIKAYSPACSDIE